MRVKLWITLDLQKKSHRDGLYALSSCVKVQWVTSSRKFWTAFSSRSFLNLWTSFSSSSRFQNWTPFSSSSATCPSRSLHVHRFPFSFISRSFQKEILTFTSNALIYQIIESSLPSHKSFSVRCNLENFRVIWLHGLEKAQFALQKITSILWFLNSFTLH